MREVAGVPSPSAPTRRLRVVQIGDVASVAPALADALSPHVDVVSLPLRQVAGEQSGAVKVLAAPLRVVDAARVARRARALDPDVVHVHWVPNGIIGPLIGRPWVLHAHGDDIRALNAWRRLAFAPLVRLADAMLVSTPDLLRFARADAALLPTPVPTLESSVTATWDVLVCSAALPVKGSPVAFETLRRLARLRPGIRLAAHDGPAYEDGPWDRLPWATKAEFRHRLASARVVLGQFRLGALGVADLEAMATGRPVLTWVREGIYPEPPPVHSSRDPSDLARRVAELLDDDDAARAAGTAAADWVARTHGPERVARQLIAVYRRLTA